MRCGQPLLVTAEVLKKLLASRELDARDEPWPDWVGVPLKSAGQTFGAAPGELGRGGKAAGHNIKEGHPIAAAKSLGKGVGRFGKKVGKGTKSAVVGTTDKVAGDHKDSTSGSTAPK